MNKCHFTGRLASDPEIRVLNGDKKLAKFTLAVGRSYKKGDEWVEETAFLDCELWDSGAERLVEKYRKGDPITAHCSVKQDNWKDKNTGANRSKLIFRVDSFEYPTFLKRSDRSEDDEAKPKAKAKPKREQEEPPASDNSSGGGDDDSIPF